MISKEIKIKVTGSDELEITINYLHLIKSQLGISRNHHIRVLALIIRKVNSLHGKYNNIAELRDLMVGGGKLKEFALQYNKGKTTNSFYQTLNDLRNLGLLDIYNIPKPYILLAPVMRLKENYDIRIVFDVPK